MAAVSHGLNGIQIAGSLLAPVESKSIADGKFRLVSLKNKAFSDKIARQGKSTMFLPPPLEPENDNLPDRHRRQKKKRKRT